jgi:hypothetical protein
MKHQLVIYTAVTIGISIVSLSYIRAGGREEPNFRYNDESKDAVIDLDIKLKEKATEIRKRLKLPSVIANSGDESEEMEIAEMFESGWIIRASVDDVESMLLAAASTPSLEDDVEARVMAHRASCRYYLSE